MTEEAINLIEKYADKLTEFMTGPGAETAMLYYFSLGLRGVLAGCAALIIAVFSTLLARRSWKRLYVNPDDFGQLTVGMFASAAAIVSFLVAFICLLDATNWVMLFHPEIGFVRDALGAVK